jgi:hypothetical protein
MSREIRLVLSAFIMVLLCSTGIEGAEREIPGEQAPQAEGATAQAAEEADADPDSEAQAEDQKKGFWESLKDPVDGKFDLTAGSVGGSGFLPLAVPFNEPALGVGLVAALAYVHPQKGAAGEGGGLSGSPPTATFGGGGGTTNGTWFAAGGHHHVFGDDKARYLGMLGGGSVNLTFYGFGEAPEDRDDGLDFTIDLVGTVQQMKFRIGGSDFFLGLQYVFAATTTTFDLDNVGEELDLGETDLAGLTALIAYDSRDTVFTPSSGFTIDLNLSWFNEAVGSDFNFERVDTSFRYYLPIKQTWVLGFRADVDGVGDEAPFYALPFVKLRGIPIFRYLGNYVVTIEIEPRFKITPRWSVLAFTGQGRAAQEWDQLSDAEHAYNFGAGFRYLIARKLGLGVGLDIATGPEETVPYLIVGSAW